MPDTESGAATNKANQAAYWKATKRLTIGLLFVWFAVSYGAGILFREALDAFSIGGAPLGFWFAQNGSIYVFLLLIVVYCIQMTRLERRFGLGG
ncbi:DUF4212 domain-containing protein [Algimonas porphyrae]|uniref:Membrane protein n=1 Tax=Algimonas porphyrae TaxID=1128113 RepID=A0ABQ5V1Y5_9PROT|nr:DUF4212 domain-containing protein [Algimonas porphyrae]GLQ21463.1 membrane protein [Algimonas porphyrae]